jgi:hypothetical protein
MKKDFKINPVGLKGNEINERMKQLMGITPINESVSRSVIELTKMGPDGKAYAIVRENHEYYIKVSDKTSNLVTEDFKYIGGLQNKKKEAYPSYAKATKHLNLSFKSLAEAYGTDSNINVFEDDDLLNEENFATKHVVDKNGPELKQEAKEGSEEDGFGDNVAKGKTAKEFEKAKKIDEGWAGFAEMSGNGFMEEGMFGDVELSEEEKYIDKMLEFDKPAMDSFKDQYGADKGEEVYYATANKQDRNPETFKKADEGYMEENLYDESYMEENLYDESYMEENMYGEGNISNEEDEMSNNELMDRLDNMSAAELIQLLGDAGKDLKGYIANKLSTGMDKARDYFNRQYPNEGMDYRHNLEEDEMSAKDKEFAALAEPKDKITYADKIAGATMDEEMSAKDKEFAALAEPKDKITYADKIAGATMDEEMNIDEMTIEEIQEAIADLKKKL